MPVIRRAAFEPPSHPTGRLLDRIAALETRVHELETHLWMLESSLPQPDVDPSETEHERWTEWQWHLMCLLPSARPGE
jgi:hypothetical protein